MKFFSKLEGRFTTIRFSTPNFMNKTLLTLLTNILIFSLSAQQLSVEQIMQDPKITVGALPSNIFWSEDSKTIYFSWNPEKNKADSLYGASIVEKKPFKVSPQARKALPSQGDYSTDFSKKVYGKNGDLFLMDCRTMAIRQITNTIEPESNPAFNGKDDKIIFTKGNNLFSFTISSGEINQLTNFQAGIKKAEPKLSEQEKWQKQDQLSLFDILKERADKKKEGDKIQKSDMPKRAKEIFVEDKSVDAQTLSPDENYITYRLVKSTTGTKSALVPSYVTESGFTEDLPARTKVGSSQTAYEFWVYDIKKDTSLQVSIKEIEGIFDEPDFLKDYVKKNVATKKDTAKIKKPDLRKVIFSSPVYSEDGMYCVVVLRSQDNKDRWIMRLDLESKKLQLIDRQRDESWIGGPGIGFYGSTGVLGFLADNQTIYFQSEVDGYAHLYTFNLLTNTKKQLTQGKFEVQSVQLSRNKQNFYLTTNEVHPGEQHFYKMSVTGGERQKLTKMVGSNQVVMSPDESKLAFLYSSSIRPWEVFLQENIANTKSTQVTDSQSDMFKKYAWREPKIITFKAEDGADVYARMYEAKGEKGKKPAVIFVHGAGYLQNVHKWWSSYFREYMFHNLLVENGYTVLDIDYRGSAGYGRDWRTGIYRFMGGKDLSDHVDGVKYLVENQGVNPKKVGLYGGSYGGFITLMAMFTKPDIFASGAALRPVTDWAAYNHGYTANILNEPQTDSIAYRRSSPIYHAEGLKGNLLICHGMVDVNVHYQDAVRLSQRLIELKKDNWELASYPMEDHGFVEPTSWMDEYKRIFKLFEKTLKE
jgi:dipeptidyl aminopeptidase/acylaminoacyl peptidase